MVEAGNAHPEFVHEILHSEQLVEVFAQAPIALEMRRVSPPDAKRKTL